ncbi:hypothetical protein J4557_46420, partial [Actinomadura nitritigenes]
MAWRQVNRAGPAGHAAGAGGVRGRPAHHQRRDDIAVLIARLRRIPEDRFVSWTLPADPAAVRRARGLVRTRL